MNGIKRLSEAEMAAWHPIEISAAFESALSDEELKNLAKIHLAV